MKRKTSKGNLKNNAKTGRSAIAAGSAIVLAALIALSSPAFTAGNVYAETSSEISNVQTQEAVSASENAKETLTGSLDDDTGNASSKTNQTETSGTGEAAEETATTKENAETKDTSELQETEETTDASESKEAANGEETQTSRAANSNTLLTVAANNYSATILVAYVDADGVNVRSGPGTGYESVGTLSYSTVIILEKVKTSDKTYPNWSKIVYGTSYGYICSDWNTNERTVTVDYDKFKEFPESYRNALAIISAVYPNYTFIADKINMTIDDVVQAHLGRKVNDAWGDEPSSYEDIEYYVNPEKFLNFNDIYMFLKQSYTGNESTDTLTKLVSGTFLNTTEYKSIIMQAAKESGVSPYAIASTILQEQGAAGNSDLISGKYKGYEGYYNFWNFNAVDGDPINQGLKYAKEQGWNSKSKSIIGGAKIYAEGYINNNQDTYYYKDYNVINKIWWHEYATAVYDALSSGGIMRNAFQGDTNAYLTFRIPVYKDVDDVKGDVNADGYVTAIDYMMIRNHVQGTTLLTDSDELSRADVNGDGKITADDYIDVKNSIMG